MSHRKSIGPAITCVGAALLVGCSHCDRSEETIAHDVNGRTVVDAFEACTSLGTTLEDSLYLILPSGQRELLITFEPTGGITAVNGKQVPGPDYPQATFASDGSLQITIGTVSSVAEKRTLVAGTRVAYRIGLILPPSP